MQKMIFISNRLPVNVVKKKGSLQYFPSAGGLATGLKAFYKKYESLWIGWPGMVTKNFPEKKEITEQLHKDKMHPIFLTKNQIEKYYEGFSNKTIWPLFHYFTEYTVYEKRLWETYRQVNKIFSEEVLKYANDNDIIWVHDYQLMLLPALLREKLPNATIGFFLHIPFPSFEIFRTLPWRHHILNGMIGADLIGFHAYDYVRHFLSAARRLLGYEHTLGKITVGDRVVKADSFPMGIDYEKFAKAAEDEGVQREIDAIRKQVGNHKLILSVDRMDYSKAIPQRLKAFDMFLEENPEYRKEVTLVLVVVPSRLKVEQYRNLKEEVDQLVGTINGKYGDIGWTPIWYLYRNLPFKMLSALYNVGDIALVTPFRDGMNLIAKEFVASRANGKGVLILSEMAGASHELGESIIINPNDLEDIKLAIAAALKVPEDDQIRHNREMQLKLSRYNVQRWAKDFFDTLISVKNQQNEMLTKRMVGKTQEKIIHDFKQSKDRLILLDYDGTLSEFQKLPQNASPDAELLDLLTKLADSNSNEVIIISGRDRGTLQEWFGNLNINLVAEHGAWLRPVGKDWETIEPLKQEWKKDLQPIIDLYIERTPGSFCETKDFSIVWHYRKADPGLGDIRARELITNLLYLTSNMDLQVLEGSKVVEIKNIGINKGKAAIRWLSRKPWDFIIAFGDDWTDEDTFRALPESAYSIKVGISSTAAKYNIKSVIEVRKLLKEFAKETQQ
ncbi:bifunctional alpha,alpha-trehalose-phosphate synthase (UDP-forming)/trehalose-phosphatase [candidate division KSB1 bacterium]|nr:bifunctional alpha,alpha-trehalose-phosphate synthase (UDP-forming)/trehalose-phosphatase [candidate division KSB1 bacterium]